jgi:hypothetical protein
MPGFVDVTGWSAEDVRRLGHADDDYEESPVYQTRRFARRTPAVPATAIATRELAALAFAAQRVNGTLHKQPEMFDADSGTVVKVTPNKVLMHNSFVPNAEGPQVSATQEDRDLANLAVDAVQSDCTMRLLQGRQLSDFVASLNTLLQQETVNQRDCGLMAFLPNIYSRMLEDHAKQETSASLSVGSQYLGNVGDKVTVDFTFVDKRYLSQYNCWSVFGHDANGNCVGFLTAHESLAKSGRIQGKIKRLEENRYRNGAKVTNLNYVKVV